MKTSAAQDVRPTDVTVYKGEQVTLNCSGTVVTWSRLPSGDKLFTSTIEDPWGTTDRNKYDIVGNYYLVINDAQPSSDSGRYQCNTNEDASKNHFADVVIIGNISVRCGIIIN